mmetsp:Transcript_24077/g.33647  ORF Transcript_24077/g.33647 Transcript_24077/m.33647 type:complete len:231 (+) Transcript_24077:165-857(+)
MSTPVQSPQAQTIIRWAIFGMSILTFIFACVSVGHCSFINVEATYASADFGLFSYKDSGGGCEKYDDPDFEAPQKTGRAFGALLMISMPCVLVTTVISTFFLGNGTIGQATWMSIRILVLVSIFCQSLTFCFVSEWEEYGVEYQGLRAAGGIAVLNLILLVALSVLTWLVPPREEAMINQCNTSKEPVTPQPVKTEVHVVPPPPQPDNHIFPDPHLPYKTTPIAPEEDID